MVKLAQKRVSTSWLDFALETPSSDVEACEIGENSEVVPFEIEDSECSGDGELKDGPDLWRQCTLALWYPLDSKRHWDVADAELGALRRGAWAVQCRTPQRRTFAATSKMLALTFSAPDEETLAVARHFLGSELGHRRASTAGPSNASWDVFANCLLHSDQAALHEFVEVVRAASKKTTVFLEMCRYDSTPLTSAIQRCSKIV